MPDFLALSAALPCRNLMTVRVLERKIRLFAPVILALVAVTTLFTLNPMGMALNHNEESDPDPILKTLTDPELVSIEIPEDIPSVFTVSVTTDTGSYELALQHTSLRAASCQLLVESSNGLTEQPLPKARTYRGHVLSIPESSVALSLLESGLHGIINFGPNIGIRFVQPVSSIGLPTQNRSKQSIEHVLYRRSTHTDPRSCAVTKVNAPLKDDSNDSGGIGESSSGGIASEPLYYSLLGLDSDYEFFQLNGSDINATVDDLELILNLSNTVFERDANLRHLAAAFIIRTTPDDPYTTMTATELACEVGQNWTFSSESNIPCGLVQFFTGRELDSSIGYAWIGSSCNQHDPVCGTYSRIDCSVVESQFSQTLDLRTALSTHELGHNWGAYHCGGQTCKIMCAQINACGGVTGDNLQFSEPSKSFILSRMETANCLELVQEPLDLPIIDTFDSTEPSKILWEYNRGAEISMLGHNEISNYRSLLLDSIGAGTYDEDLVRSSAIPLDDYLGVTLSFWVQPHGTIISEPLLVEYLADDGAWTPLTGIPNNGMNNYAFTQFTLPLPANALHSEFRLGFQPIVGDTGIRWFIDDLMLTGELRAQNDECRNAPPLTMGVHTFNTSGATNSSLDPPTNCDAPQIQSDIWYRVDAICNGELTVQTCGTTGLDTAIAIYDATTGCPTDPDIQTLACNEDSDCGNENSLAIAQVTNGQPLYVRIGTSDGSKGEGTITLFCTTIEEPCPADLDGDGHIGGSDLSFLLGDWGGTTGDINQDGTTDGIDLSLMLGSWGACAP